MSYISSLRDGEWRKYAFSTDILLLTEQNKNAKHADYSCHASMLQKYNFFCKPNNCIYLISCNFSSPVMSNFGLTLTSSDG